MNINVYDAMIKFVTEVTKAADVDSMVTIDIMTCVRTYEEQYPQPTSQELLYLMIAVERDIRKHTKAFVSFEMFPNLFTAMVIRNLGQKAEERISIICTMEGEMQVEHFKTKSKDLDKNKGEQNVKYGKRTGKVYIG